MLGTRVGAGNISWVPSWVLESDMTGEKLLAETQCKNAKPKAKVYYLNDNALEIFTQ